MKLFSVEKPRFLRDRFVKARDAQTTVKLADLSTTISTAGDQLQTATASQPSPELLYEFQSAASMIMDRAECESLLKEVEQILRSHPVAA